MEKCVGPFSLLPLTKCQEQTLELSFGSLSARLCRSRGENRTMYESKERYGFGNGVCHYQAKLNKQPTSTRTSIQQRTFKEVTSTVGHIYYTRPCCKLTRRTCLHKSAHFFLNFSSLGKRRGLQVSPITPATENRAKIQHHHQVRET